MIEPPVEPLSGDEYAARLQANLAWARYRIAELRLEIALIDLVHGEQCRRLAALGGSPDGGGEAA
jgi:hypothetical protein